MTGRSAALLILALAGCVADYTIRPDCLKGHVCETTESGGSSSAGASEGSSSSSEGSGASEGSSSSSEGSSGETSEEEEESGGETTSETTGGGTSEGEGPEGAAAAAAPTPAAGAGARAARRILGEADAMRGAPEAVARSDDPRAPCGRQAAADADGPAGSRRSRATEWR